VKLDYIIYWISLSLADSLREIPLELRQRFRGGQVNLDMEDHRDEDFSKPKHAFRAFTGEGQKLGRLENSFFCSDFLSLSWRWLDYTVSHAEAHEWLIELLGSRDIENQDFKYEIHNSKWTTKLNNM